MSVDKNITINWSIIPPDPNDLNYAEVRRSDDGTMFNNVVKTETGLGVLASGVIANFAASDVITVVNNSTKTVWYKIRVFDNDDNYTDSNVEQITIEMLPPPAPVLDPIIVN